MHNILFKIIIYSGIWAATAYSSNAATIPSFLSICKRSDPDLNACMRNSIESLRGRLGDGIPELFVPPIEPLVIPEVKMDQDSGPVVVTSSYTNVIVNGLSKFDLTHFELGNDLTSLDLNVFFPEIDLSAMYAISGKIMLMPLLGEGPCQANFTDVDVTAHIDSERYTANVNNGIKEFLAVKNITVSYTIGKSKVFLGNLFNGDSTLGSAMNAFLNDNWKSVAEEIRPLMEDVIVQMLRSITSELFSNFSIDDLLPL